MRHLICGYDIGFDKYRVGWGILTPTIMLHTQTNILSHPNINVGVGTPRPTVSIKSNIFA